MVRGPDVPDGAGTDIHRGIPGDLEGIPAGQGFESEHQQSAGGGAEQTVEITGSGKKQCARGGEQRPPSLANSNQPTNQNHDNHTQTKLLGDSAGRPCSRRDSIVPGISLRV